MSLLSILFITVMSVATVWGLFEVLDVFHDDYIHPW